MANLPNTIIVSESKIFDLPRTNECIVELFGAGGGGGAGKTNRFIDAGFSYVNTNGTGGGGGGGGTYARLRINPILLTGFTTILVVVGNGGIGGRESFEENGGDGTSTYIVLKNEKWEADGGKGGQFGEYNDKGGNGGNGGSGLINPPAFPLYATVEYTASFGGGGGIYLKTSNGYEGAYGGLGGLGYLNGVQNAEFNGNAGNKRNNIELLDSNFVRAGYGGGRRASRGGNGLSATFVPYSYRLNGAGSGGSSGNDIPSQDAINKIDNGPGIGAGYTQPRTIDANKSSAGSIGGGGGGGVGGIKGDPFYVYSGYGGSHGGNGQVIFRYA